MAIFTLVEARPLSGYRLRLLFAVGTEGDADLSHLAGSGVLETWDVPGAFESVRIGDGGGLVWPDDVDLCADSFYLKLTDQAPEDVFPRPGKTASHA